MEYFSAADFSERQDVIAGQAPDSILSLVNEDLDDAPFQPDDVDVDVGGFDPIDFNLEFPEISIANDLNLAHPDVVDHHDDRQIKEEVEDAFSGSGSVREDLFEEVPFFNDDDVTVKEEILDPEDLSAPAAYDEVVLSPDGDAGDLSGFRIKQETDGHFRTSTASSASSTASSMSDDDAPSSPGSPGSPGSGFDLSDLPLTFGAKPKEEKVVGGPEMKKPRMSYAQLIAEALMNAQDRRLTLNDIYVHINARHPFYSLKCGGKNWQNAIRHNLTLNKSFVKVPRPANEGRGSYWELEAGAEKLIFKRLLRQHYMYKVALDGASAGGRTSKTSYPIKKNPITKAKISPHHLSAKMTSKVIPRSTVTTTATVTSTRQPQIKIIRSIPLPSRAKVTAAVSSSSAAKPTIIYVTLPKNLLK